MSEKTQPKHILQVHVQHNDKKVKITERYFIYCPSLSHKTKHSGTSLLHFKLCNVLRRLTHVVKNTMFPPCCSERKVKRAAECLANTEVLFCPCVAGLSECRNISEECQLAQMARRGCRAGQTATWLFWCPGNPKIANSRFPPFYVEVSAVIVNTATFRLHLLLLYSSRS